LLNKPKKRYSKVIDGIKVYFVEFGVNKAGVSLGNFILLYKAEDTNNEICKISVHHEYGHQIQSRYFGFLYLILVGIPSLYNFIYAKKYNKDDKWYYNRYPEKWADKLGGANRWKRI
jgi:capsid portal protein